MDTFKAKDWHHQPIDADAKITVQGLLLSKPVFKLFFSLPQPLVMSFVLFLNLLESHSRIFFFFFPKKILKTERLVFMLALLYYNEKLPYLSALPSPIQVVTHDSSHRLIGLVSVNYC